MGCTKVKFGVLLTELWQTIETGDVASTRDGVAALYAVYRYMGGKKSMQMTERGAVVVQAMTTYLTLWDAALRCKTSLGFEAIFSRTCDANRIKAIHFPAMGHDIQCDVFALVSRFGESQTSIGVCEIPKNTETVVEPVCRIANTILTAASGVIISAHKHGKLSGDMVADYSNIRGVLEATLAYVLPEENGWAYSVYTPSCIHLCKQLQNVTWK